MNTEQIKKNDRSKHQQFRLFDIKIVIIGTLLQFYDLDLYIKNLDFFIIIFFFLEG